MELTVNILFLALVPLLLSGWIGFVRGLWSGTRAVSVFGVYREFFRLIREGAPSGKQTGLLAEWSPLVALTAVIFAGHLLPLSGGKPVVSFPGSLVLFVLFVWIKKFADRLNSRDLSASSGVQKHEERIPGFAELLGSAVPLTVILGILAFLGRNLSLESILTGWKIPVWSQVVIRGLAGLSFFLMMVSSSMEMVAEASGSDRAVYLYCRGFQQMLFGLLAALAVLPAVRNVALSAAILAGFLAIAGALAGSAAFGIGKTGRKGILAVAVTVTVVLLATVTTVISLTTR